jgi:hypothetical protein
VSEKKDVYEKAKKQMRPSERILAEIPGFRGYNEKELRRESDMLIRNQLYQKLSKAKSDLRDIFARAGRPTVQNARKLYQHHRSSALNAAGRSSKRQDTKGEWFN